MSCPREFMSSDTEAESSPQRSSQLATSVSLGESNFVSSSPSFTPSNQRARSEAWRQRVIAFAETIAETPMDDPDVIAV